MISLYDTLASAVRPLELRQPGRVTIYACGPTVYDEPHLGHARGALTYDILRRYLQWRGLDVQHVANITDIDDKIIERANREGLTEPELAARWDAVYVEAMEALGVLTPHQRPRATEWVDEMVDFVEGLMAGGKAYATPSGVYLRVGQVPGYGDLVHRSLDDLRSGTGARVEVDETKEDPLDFALWKAAKPGEPTWPSPWGPGRPGWHIECVTMSLGLLGDGFDLHGGGDDLVFPHHTNERAEAIAAGRDFARHWVHNAMLNVDGQKMAKSVGNFRTVGELLGEHPANARAFRLLVLQTHYRKTMEVNAEVMAQARSAAARLDAMARRAAAAGVKIDGLDLDLVGIGIGTDRPGRDPAGTGIDRPNRDPAAAAAFRAAMDADLGTPEALAAVFETLRRANAALDRGDSADAAALAATVVELAGVLGLRVGTDDRAARPGTGEAAAEPAATDEDAEIEALVAARQQARAARDFAEADRLRDELSARGVTVEDTPSGPVWHRN